jgi:hypothetical protein
MNAPPGNTIIAAPVDFEASAKKTVSVGCETLRTQSSKPPNVAEPGEIFSMSIFSHTSMSELALPKTLVASPGE